ncbi:nuclease-related domain-containing protein [Algoriphagus litoralis]|uniref:nuclease-related domain-containing protein n=1 Tax=Algoriphagus litoralis TaxID=2202829 RepID=UPI000DB99375|nr:nuclease-related domain-containing protein [Algoriphagus litoralis]
MDWLIIVFGILLGWFTFKIYFYWSDRKLLYSVTQPNRGNSSERKLVLNILKMGFPAHSIYHDLYLSKGNGYYSQIDVVLATTVGLIVFEVKNYKGWLFGTGLQQKWTQVLAYGKQKYQFYNPILQNKNHILELRKQSVQFQNLPIFSVVVFFGECVFKDISYIPKNTYLIKAYRLKEAIENIIKENPPIEYRDEEALMRFLKSAVKNGEFISIQHQHEENIKEQIGNHRILD